VASPEDYRLFVKTAFVDGGSVLKRFRPAPHGRANRIRKRMNHVTLVVENKLEIQALKYKI
jgi:large subunit ribosomal protein L22